MKKVSALIVILTMILSTVSFVAVSAEDIPIELGKQVTGQLLGQEETDIYRFKLESPGTVTITFEYPTDAPNSAWQVMLYSGKTCYTSGVNYISGSISGETRVWEVAPVRAGAGEYFVLVKNPNWRSFSNKNYNLTVNFNEESKDEYEIELNGNWQSSYSIPYNKEIKGNISNSNDWDYARIPLEYDGTIEVSFRYPENYEGSGWSVGVYFVPRSATLMESLKAEKVGKAKDGYYEIKSRKFRVPKGNYGVVVGPIDKNKLSDEEYILTVKVVDETNIPHEKEKNNDFGSANVLEFNKKVLGSLESAEDMDFAKFTLNETSDIKLYMYYPEGEQQQSWEMVLYNEKKERLGFTFNNNAGPLTDGMKTMTLSKAGLEKGTYYVSVMVPVGGTHSYSDFYLMAENKNAPIPEIKEEEKPKEEVKEEVKEFVDEQLIKTGVPTVLESEKLPPIDYTTLSKVKTADEAKNAIWKYVTSLNAEQKTTFAVADKIQTAAEFAYSSLAKTDAEKVITKETLESAKAATVEFTMPDGISLARNWKKTVTVTPKSNEAVIKKDCAESDVDSVIVKFNGASFEVPIKGITEDITVGLVNKGTSFDVTVSGNDAVKIIIPNASATIVSNNGVNYPAFLTPDGKIEAPARVSGNYTVKTENVTFTDISGLSADMQTAILDMARRGVINGVDTGKFDPAGTLTRAQTVKLIVAALGLEDKNATESFSDVAEGDWYYSYVATGAKYGFVNGYPDGTFAPDKTIFKQELLKVFAEVMKTYGGYNYPDNPNPFLVFSDAETIGDWAKSYAGFMSQSKILPLRADSKIVADKGITRAEAALMLYRMFEHL